MDKKSEALRNCTTKKREVSRALSNRSNQIFQRTRESQRWPFFRPEK